MTISPEDQTFISALRFRMAAGDPNPPTLDEMKRAIILLRDSRTKAVEASSVERSAKRSKAAPSNAAVSDALADLDAM